MSAGHLRILHLVNEVVDTGNGIVNVTVDLAVQASRNDNVVSVASKGGGFVPLLESAGVRHVEIDFRDRPWLAIVQLRRLIIEFKPDVVHAHTVAPCAISAAVRRLPSVPDYAIVATMHNVYQRSSTLMATADMTIGVAESVTDIVRSRRCRSPLVAPVVNGVVGSPRRRRREQTPHDLGPKSVVAVGAVSHRKGADVLLEAFEQLAASRADLHLWFVGNRDWDEITVRAAASPAAERIHLVGLSDDPASYLTRATVVAVASRREGLALSLLEAREAGAAIVATETDGALEGLDGGSAGVLVPVEDPHELASALGLVLDEPEHRDDLRRRSTTGLERFSVARMARDYDQKYREALNYRRR